MPGSNGNFNAPACKGMKLSGRKNEQGFAGPDAPKRKTDGIISGSPGAPLGKQGRIISGRGGRPDEQAIGKRQGQLHRPFVGPHLRLQTSLLHGENFRFPERASSRDF